MDTKYEVRLSYAANNDLDEIFSYVLGVLFAEQTAKNLMREIHEMILSLAKMPQRFSLSLDATLAQRGYRRALVKKYVILYLIDEDEKHVNILRIFHGSMDYPKYI